MASASNWHLKRRWRVTTNQNWGACDKLNSKWLGIMLVISPSALWGQSFMHSWSLLAMDSTTVGFASSLGAISNLQTDEATVPVTHRHVLNGALRYLICTSPVESEWVTGLPSCSSSVLWTSVIVFLVAPFAPFLYCLGQPLWGWDEAQQQKPCPASTKSWIPSLASTTRRRKKWKRPCGMLPSWCLVSGRAKMLYCTLRRKSIW